MRCKKAQASTGIPGFAVPGPLLEFCECSLLNVKWAKTDTDDPAQMLSVSNTETAKTGGNPHLLMIARKQAGQAVGEGHNLSRDHLSAAG